MHSQHLLYSDHLLLQVIGVELKPPINGLGGGLNCESADQQFAECLAHQQIPIPQWAIGHCHLIYFAQTLAHIDNGPHVEHVVERFYNTHNCQTVRSAFGMGITAPRTEQ